MKFAFNVTTEICRIVDKSEKLFSIKPDKRDLSTRRRRNYIIPATSG
jgi:hypothetical protein